jgi:hypothetical protein
MAPTSREIKEPRPDDHNDPFYGPCTIPDGWDVSAFYAPERDNLPYYGQQAAPSEMSRDNGHTENS